MPKHHWPLGLGSRAPLPRRTANTTCPVPLARHLCKGPASRCRTEPKLCRACYKLLFGVVSGQAHHPVVSMGAATGACSRSGNSLSLAAAALVFVLPVVGPCCSAGARRTVASCSVSSCSTSCSSPLTELYGGQRAELAGAHVYVAVVLLVAVVVSRLQQLRSDSARRAADSRQLLQLSELLVADKPLRELLAVIASSVRSAFNSRQSPSSALGRDRLPRDRRIRRHRARGESLDRSCLSRARQRHSRAASSPAHCCDRSH